MTHELRRPFLFSVHHAKRPAIGIIPQDESERLYGSGVDFEDSHVQFSQDERHEHEVIDVRRRTSIGALPSVFSPRPDKRRHIVVSAPSPVPNYPRFHPKLSMSQPKPPASPRNSLFSPVLSKRRTSTAKGASSRMTLAPLTNQTNEPDHAADAWCSSGANSIPAEADHSSAAESKDISVEAVDEATFPEPQRSLVRPPPLVSSVASRNLLGDSMLYGRKSQMLAPPPKALSPDRSPTRLTVAKVVVAAATVPATAEARSSDDAFSSTVALVEHSFSAAPRVALKNGTVPKFEEEERTPVSSVPFKFSLSNKIHAMGERVIARHVMRSKYLKKYLHVKHLSQKMKETELLLRTRQLGQTDGEKIGSTSKLLSEIKQELPSFRRLTTMDKTINETVQKIRRLSGLNKLASNETDVNDKKRYLGPADESKSSIFTPGSDSDGSEGLTAGVDPSSAHFFQICQHVIAKHTITLFMRQESSVMTQVESAYVAEHNDRKATTSIFSTTEPINALHPDVVSAVRVYLRESDLRLTVDDLYEKAIDAESSRRWKRAILLASACIVVDHESILPSLLRARCCRRIGLWSQAVKDLTNAILQRNDDYKLFLQRGFLYLRLSDLENGLVDATRALGLNAKSVEALLLRAELFSRKGSLHAAFQDLATVLVIDPQCWRAFYDRAALRLRGIEGDEETFQYHWESMRYEVLLASIIDDFLNALRHDCHIVEVAETIGDFTVRLLEYTNDANVLRHVIKGFSDVLVMLTQSSNPAKSSRLATPAEELQQQLIQSQRAILIAALLTQRGRMYALLHQFSSALSDLDEASVKEFHYAVSHFYRGAIGCLMGREEDLTAAYAAHLSRCIALDPTIAGAYIVRGALYLRDLKFSNALHDFKAAVSADPTLCDIWMQIALIYLNHYHDSEACARSCSNALANDTALTRALYVRAEAATRQGDLTHAIRDYARISHFQQQDRWAVLMRGRLLLQLRQYRAALYSFISFIELGPPSDHHLSVLCGRAYKILSRFTSAVRVLQKAVTLDPSAENLVLLSESLHSMGDTENSLRVSEQVINSDPNSHKGYIRRAQLLVSIGQWDAAIEEYNRAILLAPKEPRILYERGIVLLQLYKSALRHKGLMRHKACSLVSTASEESTTSPVALEAPSTPTSVGSVPDASRLASSISGANDGNGSSEPQGDPANATPGAPMSINGTNNRIDNFDESQQQLLMRTYYSACISDFTKCIRFCPSFSDAYVDRAEMYRNGEEYTRAFRDLETAVELNPKCARAHVNLGVLKCHFMAFASAIADFDKATRHDPTLALAFFNRGVCYHRLSLWSQAETSYSECIRIWGEARNIDAHRNRGIARCQLGDYEGALADFEAVQQVAPDDDQLHGGMGYVLLQLGRGQEAAKCFASFGRLSRDTYVDSGNVFFNLGSQYHAQTITGQYNASTEQQVETPLEEIEHVSYIKMALRMYLRAARIDPMNPNIRLNISNCLRLLHHECRAIEQCKIILNLCSHAHPAVEGKALALYQLGRFDQAIDQMDQAIRLCVASSPGLENVFYAFSGDSLHRHTLERKQKVTSRFAVMDDLTPSSESTHYTSKRKNLRQYIEEIALYGSARQMLSLYLTNRGILYEKVKNWDRARDNYRDAIFFDPQSFHGHFSLGSLELLCHRYQESVRCFQRLIELHPKSGIAHINLGVSLMLTGDKTNAMKSFDAAIALIPKCSYTYANKAVVLANDGNLKHAEMLLKRAITELPSHHGFYVAKGRLIAQQKRLQDAMVDFSTALHLGYPGKL